MFEIFGFVGFGRGGLLDYYFTSAFDYLNKVEYESRARLILFVTIPTFTNAVYTVYTFCRKQGTLGHHKRKLILEFGFLSTETKT